MRKCMVRVCGKRRMPKKNTRKVRRNRLATKFFKVEERLRKDLNDKFENSFMYDSHYRNEPCEICIAEARSGRDAEYATFKEFDEHVKRSHFKDYKTIRLRRFATRFSDLSDALVQKPCELCLLDSIADDSRTYNLTQLYQHVLLNHEARKSFMLSLVEKYLDKQFNVKDLKFWLCPGCVRDKNLFNFYSTFKTLELHIKRDHPELYRKHLLI